MKKVIMYDKPMFIVHLDMVSRLEAKIKESSVLKDKKYNWIGTCTLTKTNPNTGCDYEVGGMALACYYYNEKAVAILVKSDMGLVEQFMKEFEGFEKIYLFSKKDYDSFNKFNEKKIEIVMV